MATTATTTVWLDKPHVPRDADSVARMRRAIEQDAPHQNLIAECLNAARARGLSGEETYVFLAYYALLHLEETHQSHIYLSDIATPAASGPAPVSPPRPRRQPSAVWRRAGSVARECMLLIVQLLARATYLALRVVAYVRRLSRTAAATWPHVAACLKRGERRARRIARVALAHWEEGWSMAFSPHHHARAGHPQREELRAVAAASSRFQGAATKDGARGRSRRTPVDQ